jgi:hypothetical protein
LRAKLFHAEERTDVHTNKKKPTVALRKFAELPKVNTKEIDLRNCIIPNTLYFTYLCYLKFSINSMFVTMQTFLQSWGDYTDMSQAVLGYVTYASDVFLICWFGTQLTQHVR